MAKSARKQAKKPKLGEGGRFKELYKKLSKRGSK